jgi:hypothetical protein
LLFAYLTSVLNLSIFLKYRRRGEGGEEAGRRGGEGGRRGEEAREAGEARGRGRRGRRKINKLKQYSYSLIHFFNPLLQ